MTYIAATNQEAISERILNGYGYINATKYFVTLERII